ncbi:tetratricopeptide repeat protein [Nitrospirillum iridis]|uniref:Tetratricopeptide (TPR) repeat protein n=1 Tax=Nitrospirillum iridis TaxID=765888 RepID=A0A7X0EC60_9PROT|nr:tetratricopeptide repeat protein [Nitrospirillum iridis]MBB6251382.1 tetratricopeptide (TPR) repeat protein [Nitrospirillum iridis]
MTIPILTRARAAVAAGRAAEAESLYRQALAGPEAAAACRGLADLLALQNRLEEAASLYERARAQAPLDGPGWLALSLVHVALGREAEALAAAEHAAALLPADATAWATVAERRRRAGRMAEAGAAYAHLAAVPGVPASLAADAENGLAMVARHDGRAKAAEAHWRRAITLDPTFAGAYANLGNLLLNQRNLPRALSALRRCLELDPTQGSARMDLALVLKGLGRGDEAEAALRQVLAEAGANQRLANDAGFNLARLLLLRGPGDEAWTLNESRWKASSFPSVRRSFPVPVWRGDNLLGRTLLLWGEQGLGDEIMFASQVPDLAAGLSEAVRAAGTAILLECDARLVPLFARSFAPVTVVGRPPQGPGEDQADHRTRTATAQLPTGSLARYCRPHLSSFRGARPYLTPDPDRTAFWSGRVGALGPGLKVGICWTSGLITADRAASYGGLEDWMPLAKVPGIHLINLQYNRDAVVEELSRAQSRGLALTDWHDLDLKNDLDGTAALISALDLVVTAPTSIGELAAALGVPTWRLSNPRDDWSALGTAVRPWFPAMRVIPPIGGETLAVTLRRVAGELRRLAAPVDAPVPAPTLAQALALHQNGQVAQAEAAYRRLLTDARDQTRGDTLHLLGLLLHQTGRTAEAEPLLREVLQAEPGFFEAWNSLGAVLLALGRRDEAADAWRAALRLNPGYDKAAANLGRLMSGP